MFCTHFVYGMQSLFWGISTVFNKNMSNYAVQVCVFYGNAWASLLSIIIRNHEYVHNNGGKTMAKCPKCGTEVAKAKKTWKMAGRPDKAGKRMQLEIGLYQCPKCSATFREVLSKKKI
jgi:uncharacterized protein (UPF0212 family)